MDGGVSVLDAALWGIVPAVAVDAALIMFILYSDVPVNELLIILLPVVVFTVVFLMMRYSSPQQTIVEATMVSTNFADEPGVGDAVFRGRSGVRSRGYGSRGLEKGKTVDYAPYVSGVVVDAEIVDEDRRYM